MLEFSLTRTGRRGIKCLSVNNGGNVMARTGFDCQVPGTRMFCFVRLRKPNPKKLTMLSGLPGQNQVDPGSESQLTGLVPVPLTTVVAPPEDLPLTPHFLHFLNSSQIPGFCQCLEYYNSLLLLKIFVCV